MPSPKVSVIIISYNRSADLRLSIEALLASKYPDLEIIVVDNASTDDAADVAASFRGIKLIRNPDNKGFAEASNQGLAVSTGRYIALVNNDAVVDPRWLHELAAFLDTHPKTCAVGGKAYFWNEANPLGRRQNDYYAQTQVDSATGYTYAALNERDEVREVATLSRCAVMVRRAAIDDIGLPFLEPTFFTYYEETDFFARAIRKGWQIHYLGLPAVWHRVRGGTQSSPYRYLYYIYRNRALLMWRNASDATLRIFKVELLARVAWEAQWHPIRLLRGKDDDARARRDTYRWLFKNRKLMDAQRKALAHLGPTYEERVMMIQSRASYYGHERPEVGALVPTRAKRVIDVGCGFGALGRALKAKRPGIEVRGIEPVPEQAARAREVLDDVANASAESGLPAGWDRPDCVVFADVLEHLVNPWTTLARWRGLLAPGGTLIVSIPNVSHRSVVFGALIGRWEYQEEGVLDRTHLRFFTRKTAIELVQRAGFSVSRVDRLVDLRNEGQIRKLALLAVSLLRKRETPHQEGPALYRFPADLSTLQFLIVAS